MDYELTLRSSRYAADVNVDSEDDIPGRPLAEEIATELRKQGYPHVDVVNSAPLWEVKVSKHLTIIAFVFQPARKPGDALWMTCVASTRGLWARLIGQPEDPDVLKLAKAMKKAVLAIDGLTIVGSAGPWDL